MSESTTFASLELEPDAPAALDALARRVVQGRLRKLAGGEIAVLEPEGAHCFGSCQGEDKLRATVRVKDRRFYRRMLMGGEIGGIESYADGDWDCDDLAALSRIMVRSAAVREGLDGGLARFVAPLRRLEHWRRRNTRAGSRSNIAAHYDVGNDFYRLFLDPSMTYSSGIFEHEGATMLEASRAKYDRLCRKLELRPDDHLLEIGTGWGGMALHAASRYGVRVTTTTISREQYELARERVAAAGLQDRISVLFEDYRDLRGSFDKLVSIEMIEAVGHEYHESFFRVCGSRLAPHGRMALQAITVPDARYERARREVDFIKRHVFPGGCLLSVGRIAEAGAAAAGLRMVHLEDITPQYAETLRRWRASLEESRAAARALGYGERFLRLWEFYLAYCEAGFEERWVGNVQAVLVPESAR